MMRRPSASIDPRPPPSSSSSSIAIAAETSGSSTSLLWSIAGSVGAHARTAFTCGPRRGAHALAALWSLHPARAGVSQLFRGQRAARESIQRPTVRGNDLRARTSKTGAAAPRPCERRSHTTVHSGCTQRYGSRRHARTPLARVRASRPSRRARREVVAADDAAPHDPEEALARRRWRPVVAVRARVHARVGVGREAPAVRREDLRRGAVEVGLGDLADGDVLRGGEGGEGDVSPHFGPIADRASCRRHSHGVEAVGPLTAA
mmetsp:Transcript_3232/g.9727  ORF Transcript_3232/g.9727 Transcript_3232/m.9727 type:complete len:262 (+) Transcript_3232:1343-2128(+)